MRSVTRFKDRAILFSGFALQINALRINFHAVSTCYFVSRVDTGEITSAISCVTIGFFLRFARFGSFVLCA